MKRLGAKDVMNPAFQYKDSHANRNIMLKESASVKTVSSDSPMETVNHLLSVS